MSNRELLKKYPFLIIKNRWTGEPIDQYDNYDEDTPDEEIATELYNMPTGWRIAFGEKICEEIQNELDKLDSKIANDYRILQIKEKFGTLRWYSNWYTDKMNDIIEKYERLSERTCIRCGAPATKISKGWISPWCDKCAEKNNVKNYWTVDEYFNDDYEKEQEDY